MRHYVLPTEQLAACTICFGSRLCRCRARREAVLRIEDESGLVLRCEVVEEESTGTAFVKRCRCLGSEGRRKVI